jgi:Holliday junction resolvasome RuvABC endonuclease subunit
MSKILALDISSVSTGHCIVHNGRLVKSTLGTISNDPKICLGKKLVRFEEEITKLINKHKPDCIVIEDILGAQILRRLKHWQCLGVCALKYHLVYLKRSQ